MVACRVTGVGRGQFQGFGLYPGIGDCYYTLLLFDASQRPFPVDDPFLEKVVVN